MILKVTTKLLDKIDEIQLNFSEDTMLIMNICLMLIMFSVALDMKYSDFKKVIQFPKSVGIGLFAQLILLPILTVLIILVFEFPPSVNLGLLMIAACPGGNVSNFATHLSKGNTALSVTLTSMVTLGAIFLTPFTFTFWSGFVPGTDAIMENISLRFIDLFKIIVQLIFIPLTLGMLINQKLPSFADKIRTFFKRLAILIYAAFIIVALATNIDNIINYLYLVFFIVIFHNISAMALGYYFPRLLKRSKFDSRAICFETGIQNSGLGLILIINFFGGLGGMVVVAAWWGIWDLISSFGLAMYWNRRPL